MNEDFHSAYHGLENSTLGSMCYTKLLDNFNKFTKDYLDPESESSWLILVKGTKGPYWLVQDVMSAFDGRPYMLPSCCGAFTITFPGAEVNVWDSSVLLSGVSTTVIDDFT